MGNIPLQIRDFKISNWISERYLVERREIVLSHFHVSKRYLIFNLMNLFTNMHSINFSEIIRSFT